MFKFYVDAAGDDNYLPLRNSPTLELVPGDPHRLGIVMPSGALAGKPTWCIVRVEDRYGNPTPEYQGRVGFESSDTKAQLPAVYTFKREDGGVKRFDNVVFNSAGPQTVTVGDGKMKRISNPVLL